MSAISILMSGHLVHSLQGQQLRQKLQQVHIAHVHLVHLALAAWSSAVKLLQSCWIGFRQQECLQHSPVQARIVSSKVHEGLLIGVETTISMPCG